MAANRVTIQDIADALGVSRNTVSKAINNTGILADATRERVLQKAVEMGYKQFSYAGYAGYTAPASEAEAAQAAAPAPGSSGEIALFTTKFLGDSHFSSTMLDKFQREMSQLGYCMSMHRLFSDEVKNLQLPATFIREKTAGIICYEMFDHAYSQMLCELDIPILFVDTPVIGLGEPLKADRLIMDNQTGIYAFIREMNRRRKTNIGFIGEYEHCQSFFERYMAYCNALELLGLPRQKEFCFLHNKEGVEEPFTTDYQKYLYDGFSKLPKLPDVFICANDFVAIDALCALRAAGYRVPQDVYLCGFDDSPESRILTPSLTTIHIHSQIMGVSAVQLLVSRIKEPQLNYRTIYTETSLIYRESTED